MLCSLHIELRCADAELGHCRPPLLHWMKEHRQRIVCRVATQVGSGALCEVYDGGADFTGDNPFQWTIDPQSYSTTPTAAELALPAACADAAPC